MKLIQKTTQIYLAYTLVIFGLGAILFYFLIKIVLLNSIDAGLRQEKDQLVSNLELERDIEKLIPSENVIIHKISRLEHVKDKFSTVEIYDSTQNSYVAFRQLESEFSFHHNCYEIIIRHSLEEAETLLQGLLPMVIILFLVLLSGIFLINNFVFRLLWDPFYSLISKLKEYDLNKNKVIRYNHSDIQEFNELSLGVEKMTDRIYKDYLTQKEFNENSSHELQTPLAVIRNKLDLLIQSQNLSESDLEIVDSIYGSVKKLANLNKGLILLSKIENRQFPEREEVNLKAIIEKAIEDFSHGIQEKSITLTFNYFEKEYITSNHCLIDILFNNLLSNAIKHNFENGKIDIVANAQAISISNTGHALSVEPEEMFGRFKKDSGHPGSIGLGLAIVKKICDVLKYEVIYKNPGKTHNFEIILEK